MKKYIALLLLCILFTGCTGEKITGTYRKVWYSYDDHIFPQIMQYTVKNNQLQEYIATCYAQDMDELEAYLRLQYNDYLERFGGNAISTNKFFDESEQLFAGTFTINYNKINDEVLSTYIEKNEVTRESLTTVEGIYNFYSYEKLIHE